MVGKFFFGDDIFVSYSRSDGASYAAGLADELAERKFSCRLDLWETVPGTELPASLMRRLRACRMLLVIGTRAAAASPHVEKEIREFVASHSQPRIIVIQFDCNLEDAAWFDCVRGLPREREPSSNALTTGVASPNVLSRIDRSFAFTRRNDRLRRTLFVTSAAIVFAVLIGYTLLTSLKHEADELTRANLARKIASQANLLGSHSDQVGANWPETIQTSALLAVNASLRLDTPETSSALRQALDRLPRSDYLLGGSPDGAIMLFDPTGNHLAVMSNDGDDIKVWRIKDLSHPLRIDFDCRNLVFSRNGQYLALTSNDGTLSVWDVDKGFERWSKQFSRISDAVAVDGAQDRFVIAADGNALVLDFETGEKAGAIPLQSEVDTFAFSRDGKRLAISSAENVCLWESASANRPEGCFKDDSYLEAIEFSPDQAGNLLATTHGSESGGAVSIWNVALRKKISSFKRPPSEGNGVDHVFFSEDGTRIGCANTGPDGDSENWDVATGTLREIGDSGPVQGHTESPLVTWDGLYAGIPRDHGIEIWNVASGLKERRVVVHHLVGEIDSFAYSANGLLAIATPSQVWLYDTRSASQTASIERRENGPISDVGYSHEKYIALASGPVISVWDVAGVAEIARLVTPEEVRHMKFSKDSRLLAGTIEGNLVRVWEMPSGSLLASFRDVPRNRAVEDITFSPLGSYLLITEGESNEDIRIFVSRGGPPLAGLPHGISQALFSSDETYIATVAGSTLAVRNLKTGQTWEDPRAYIPLCFTSDAKRLFTTNPADRFEVEVRESATGHVSASFRTSSRIKNAQLSPDQRYLVATGAAAIIWDLQKNREIFSQKYKNNAGLVEFSAAGHYVAFASGRSVYSNRYAAYDASFTIDQVVVWDLQQQREVARISHKSAVEGLSFSDDERYFGTASDDGTSELLDLTTGLEIAKFQHDGAVHKAFFSKDAQLVGTASADLVTRVWSTRTGEEVAWLNHRGGIYDGHFSLDDQSITTFSDDQRMTVWPLTSTALRSIACASLHGRELSVEDWKRYIGNEQYRKTCTAAASPSKAR